MKEGLLKELLIDQGYNWALPMLESAEKEPFYGKSYMATFGSKESEIGTLRFISEYLPKGSRFLEIMAGNGLDTITLKNILGENYYYGVSDKREYFTKVEGLQYKTIDCLEPYPKDFDPMDLVFVGNTNSSLCMFLKVDEIINLAKFLQGAVKYGGYTALSFPEFTLKQDSEIAYNIHHYLDIPTFGEYKGREVEWLLFERTELSKNIKGFRSLTSIEGRNYLTDYKATRAWQPEVIHTILLMHGFSFIKRVEDISFFLHN